MPLRGELGKGVSISEGTHRLRVPGEGGSEQSAEPRRRHAFSGRRLQCQYRMCCRG